MSFPKVLALANPRGFCAGVDRAIEIVERALEHFGAPIYVRHEVVHNRFVVENLKAKGAVFIEDLTEVPQGGILIFSSHGVSQEVRQQAQDRELKIFDATCPLVTKVHLEVARHNKDGREVILIGHQGHPEVEGTMGQYHNLSGGIYLIESVAEARQVGVKNPNQLAYVTQTTLSVDDTQQIVEALRLRFPAIQGPKKNDICYATQNRQDAVKKLAQVCDVVLVVGSPNSSNSNRLREVSEKMGTPAYLVDNVSQIDAAWLANKKKVGVTAGASAPEVLVQQVIAHLQQQGVMEVLELPGLEEKVTFSLPQELRP